MKKMFYLILYLTLQLGLYSADGSLQVQRQRAATNSGAQSDSAEAEEERRRAARKAANKRVEKRLGLDDDKDTKKRDKR